MKPASSIRRSARGPAALAYMRDGEWKHILEQFMARLKADGAALNEALGPIARRSLAAGVYIRGRKPQIDALLRHNGMTAGA